MMRVIKKFLWTSLFFALIVIFGLSYLGFVPGLSGLFGSGKPVDLQASTTANDLLSAEVKLGQEVLTDKDRVPSLKTIRNGGTSTVNTRLTGREFAAHLEAIHPIKNVQVVFYADGTFAASGQIDKSRIVGYAKMLGYEKVSEVNVLHTINKYLPGSPTVYLRGSGGIADGVPTMKLSEAKIGRLPASTTGVAKVLVDYAKWNLEKVPGLDITTMNITGDGVSIIGTVPAAVPQL